MATALLVSPRLYFILTAVAAAVAAAGEGEGGLR